MTLLFRPSGSSQTWCVLSGKRRNLVSRDGQYLHRHQDFEMEISPCLQNAAEANSIAVQASWLPGIHNASCQGSMQAWCISHWAVSARHSKWSTRESAISEACHCCSSIIIPATGDSNQAEAGWLSSRQLTASGKEQMRSAVCG